MVISGDHLVASLKLGPGRGGAISPGRGWPEWDVDGADFLIEGSPVPELGGGMAALATDPRESPWAEREFSPWRGTSPWRGSLFSELGGGGADSETELPESFWRCSPFPELGGGRADLEAELPESFWRCSPFPELGGGRADLEADLPESFWHCSPFPELGGGGADSAVAVADPDMGSPAGPRSEEIPLVGEDGSARILFQSRSSSLSEESDR